MTQKDPFKWKHFAKEIILLCVRWYLRYSLSYRNLEEMMREKGIEADRTTIYRWGQKIALKREPDHFSSLPTIIGKLTKPILRLRVNGNTSTGLSMATRAIP